MALLNQFQQYSQGENTVTNNVLLMLSSLYEMNAKYYGDFIKGLIEHNEYEVIPDFRQQVGNKGNGVIDGQIYMRPSRIIIETKVSGLEGIQKLLKYSESFKDNEQKILLHLSSQKYPERQLKEIQNQINIGRHPDIHFYSSTYQDLVDQLKSLAMAYPFDPHLQRLKDQFESYCINMDLMPAARHRLRAMACGGSYELNVKHRFYFDLASRGYSHFNYFGIYKEKCVHYIGLVENVIVADWEKINGLQILESRHPVTEEQIKWLSDAIEDSVASGWEIQKDHRFFLLKDLEKTEFEKKSPGGIMRVRYFDLESHIKTVPADVKSIAQRLSEMHWE